MRLQLPEDLHKLVRNAMRFARSMYVGHRLLIQVMRIRKCAVASILTRTRPGPADGMLYPGHA